MNLTVSVYKYIFNLLCGYHISNNIPVKVAALTEVGEIYMQAMYNYYIVDIDTVPTRLLLQVKMLSSR